MTAADRSISVGGVDVNYGGTAYPPKNAVGTPVQCKLCVRYVHSVSYCRTHYPVTSTH